MGMLKKIGEISINTLSTIMEMTKEEYEAFSEARLSRNSSVEKDDDLFGELDLSINREDLYVWSTIGQCWLPK